ncbi:MAG: hypothetical protein OXF63_10580 [Anaerolineaceae bacterium]|nr:hypothetical protein [Anaerolineaceae bacterium]
MRLNERAALALLLVAYLLLAALFAARTPAWQAPDEPAHYNVLRQLHEAPAPRCCPVIEPGDWDQALLARLTGERFAGAAPETLAPLQYEDHQPPLYYLLAALVYEWSAGSLPALRLFSALLGAGVVYCAHALARAALPGRPWLALTAAAFVAFLPQHLAMMSAVNNDSLNELLIGLALVALARWLRGDRAGLRRLARALLPAATALCVLLLLYGLITLAAALLFLALTGVGLWLRRSDRQTLWPLWFMGLLAGLLLVTKPGGYFVAGLLPLVLLLRLRPAGLRRRRAARQLLVAGLACLLAPALLTGGLWWARNLAVYGWPDLLGLAAHDRVVLDQLRRADLVAEIGAAAWAQRALRDTFTSFWGQFGWMALPLQGRLLLPPLALSLAAVSGLLLSGRPCSGRGLRQLHRALWLVIGLTALAYLYYNLEFVQLQGRYLYPALLPLALLLARGLDAWRTRLLPGRLPWLTLLPVALLAPFSFWLLLTVIEPLLSA